MSKRRATAAESRYMDQISDLSCAVCGCPPPSAVHHIREGQGGSQRAPHWLTVPLCYDCHQGPQGIHGDRSAWRLRKLSELDVLADTIGRLQP